MHSGETQSDSAKETKQRIEYFDLAKGICILLVVMHHIGIETPIDNYLNIIRMPLYFYLSGYFFKRYDGFISFLIKKTNKLLVPFFFFYLTTAVLIPITAHHLVGISFALPLDWKLLYAFLTYNDYPNLPLWFLWGLFVLNIVFYGLHKAVGNVWILGAVCLILFYALGHTFDFPASLNKVFDGMIFFYFGYIFRLKNLSQLFSHKMIILIMACLFIGLGFIETSNDACILILRIAMAVTGVLSLIYLCQLIKHIPYISYVGRYSIMLLVTHEPLIKVMSLMHIANPYIRFAIIAASYLALIPLMRKFMPHVTAQKDLIILTK